MKKLFLAALMLPLFAGCKSATVQAVLQPIDKAACSAETSAIASLASAIAAPTAFNCSNQAQIVSDITQAIGNANACNYVTANVVAKGVVGNLVCASAVPAIIGFATNSLPVTWGCTASVAAGSLTSSLTSLCEGAIPLVVKPKPAVK